MIEESAREIIKTSAASFGGNTEALAMSNTQDSSSLLSSIRCSLLLMFMCTSLLRPGGRVKTYKYFCDTEA